MRLSSFPPAATAVGKPKEAPMTTEEALTKEGTNAEPIAPPSVPRVEALPRSTLEAQGMPSAAVLAFVDDAERRALGLAMRVRHLLSMSTGHDQDTTGSLRAAADGDWVRAFLALPVEHAPGTHFVYNSGATYLVSAIVQKATGQTLLDFLGPRLFGPLGIAAPTWGNSPQGINVGGWGLSITTEDIARFGLLYLQDGEWGGGRLLPPHGWLRRRQRRSPTAATRTATGRRGTASSSGAAATVPTGATARSASSASSCRHRRPLSRLRQARAT